jgi:hypothetical protein
LNLLNKDWGARDFGSTNSPQILQRRGFVAAPGHTPKMADQAQGTFNYVSTNQFNVQNVQSNYAMQFQLILVLEKCLKAGAFRHPLCICSLSIEPTANALDRARRRLRNYLRCVRQHARG